MSPDVATSIYALLDTRTMKFLRFGNKVAWQTKQAAGNAYTFHTCTFHNRVPKFSEQSDVIAVDLLEYAHVIWSLDK